MKTNYNLFIIFLSIAIPVMSISQDSTSFEFKFEVNQINPYISTTVEELNQANTLNDLNKHYKSSWIRKYISVEITTINEGQIMKAISKDNILSLEQKNNMNTADLDTDIQVYVRYIPENTMKDNDIKELDFSFKVSPDSNATFPGGEQKLNQYLKDNVINKIAKRFNKFDFIAIKFSINKNGQIVDPHLNQIVSNRFEDEETKKLLLETICNMPIWKPAEYNQGLKVNQDFNFIVGDFGNCMIYLVKDPSSVKND